MSQDIKNYSLLAAESYRYSKGIADKQLPSQIDDSDYYLVDDLSDKDSCVYVNPMRREIVLSIKGTSTLDNVITDISVWDNTLTTTSLYQKVERKLNRVIPESKQLQYKLIITSHSLGADIALELGRKYIHEISQIYMFNIGYSINMFFHNITLSIGCKFLKDNRVCETESEIKKKMKLYTSKDPLSILSVTYGASLVKPEKWYNPHSLSNFYNMSGGGFEPQYITEFLHYHR